jgi:UDP-N-acetylglucosamine transferase subunit ALG13
VIFVTVGTSNVPFDRLLQAFDRFEGSEALVVQHGVSHIRPSKATTVDFMTFDEVVEHMRAARVVVTHAGVGSVMSALAVGKRPLVLPRRRSFHETADDHQVELARRLASSELVIVIEDVESLAAMLESEGNGDRPPPTYIPHTTSLADELRGYLEQVISGPSGGK